MTISISGSSVWTADFNFPVNGETGWDVGLTEAANALANRTKYLKEDTIVVTATGTTNIPNSNTRVYADTTSGAITLNLPATPSDSITIKVKKIGGSSLLTVDRNTKQIELQSQNVSISGNLEAYEFHYNNANNSWFIW